MKKEQNRYFLVEYCGKYQRTYETEEQLNNALDIIRKYNNRTTEPYIVGNMNITRNNGRFVLYFHMYNKLTKKKPITEIDQFTSQFSEDELVESLFGQFKTVNNSLEERANYYPDINIAYFEDRNKADQDDNLVRRIKYIPVLYREDTRYLDEEFIDDCLSYHASRKDLKFFSELLDEFRFFQSCADELDALEKAIDRVRNQGYRRDTLYYAAISLYKHLIREREKDGTYVRNRKGGYQLSRRRMRDFGFFVKNFDSNSFKSPLRYNHTNNHDKQETIDDVRARVLNIEEEQLEMNLDL